MFMGNSLCTLGIDCVLFEAREPRNVLGSALHRLDLTVLGPG